MSDTNRRLHALGLGDLAVIGDDTTGEVLLMPSGLSAEVVNAWDEIAPQVDPSITSAGLEALATAMVRLRDARSRIEEDGMLVVGAQGKPVHHPAVAVEAAAVSEIRAWVSKFGR